MVIAILVASMLQIGAHLQLSYRPGDFFCWSFYQALGLAWTLEGIAGV